MKRVFTGVTTEWPNQHRERP